MRDDLQMIVPARFLGWEPRYSENDKLRLSANPGRIPADAVSFERTLADGTPVRVWKTRVGWRSALLLGETQRFAAHRTHGWADDALTRALAYEYPAEALGFYRALLARRAEAVAGYDATDWRGAAYDLNSPERKVGMGYQWCMNACDNYLRDHRQYLALADTDEARAAAIPAVCLPQPLALPFMGSEPDMFGRTN